MSTAESRVIDKINREIGADFKKLYKSKNLAVQFQQDIATTESKISLDNSKVTSRIKTALNLSAAKCLEIDEAVAKIDKYGATTNEKMTNYEIILDGVQEKLQKVQNLNNLVAYFRILQDIQDLSTELLACINGKDESKTVSLYLALCSDSISSNSVLGRLRDINAPHIKHFALETASYWHEALKEKFSKDYENILKSMKWPHLQQSVELFNPSKELLNKLSTVSEYLFLIKPPGDANTLSVKITPTIICPPISLPIQLLIRPFRQRFQYHFSGSRQTNRLDKPEWYYTQILSWIRDNQLLVAQNLQTAAGRAGISELNVRLEFVRGLVQLAIEKLCADIDQISRDEALFSHLLDETLSFEQELKELVKINYLSSFPTAITVLTQPQLLIKWLNIEKKFSNDRMDAILSSPSPWECLDPGNNEDIKIPKCADQFIRLLDAIRERYCCLPQPGHQIQFLELQLELIESFRISLSHLNLNPTANNKVSTIKILNTINYLTSVLREWGENVHYLHLHAARLGPGVEEINSVFDEPVDKLENWQRTLVKELASKIMNDIKAKSMPYRHDLWVSMSEQNSKEPFLLSVTAGEMFQIMVTSLHNLEADLSANLFSIVLRLIAHQLDDFFIDNMIMNTKFSVGGAAQFQYDMVRNLFPLFGQYTRFPEMLFKRVQNACVLLTLPSGTAMLLCDTIRGETNLEISTEALKPFHIKNMTTSMVIDILERRIDISK